MALLTVSPGKYRNIDAVNNLIRYIFRERINETLRSELLDIGGKGVSDNNVEKVIYQFEYIQEIYNIEQKKGSRRMFHEVFSISEVEEELLQGDVILLHNICLACAEIYYNQGHQVVFGIHKNKERGLHVHFGVNAVNFINGKKWHDDRYIQWERGYTFNWILYSYLQNRDYLPALCYWRNY